MQHKGRLYGVSLGPGDPGLITRNAWECLQRHDTVWTYPKRNRKSESYALDIVLRAGLELPADHCELIFPMTHDQELLARHWLAAAEQVVEFLHAGKDVLFLVEGDASTYSTFGHLARSVRGLDEEIEYQVIAGVASFNAAAACSRFDLSETDDTIAIIPAGYGLEMIERLMQDFDTLILMKVKPLIDEIIGLLRQREILQHAVFIERAGTPEERIVSDVASLKGETVNYLSLMLVKNPHRQRGEMIRGCRKKSTQK